MRVETSTLENILFFFMLMAGTIAFYDLNKRYGYGAAFIGYMLLAACVTVMRKLS